MESVSNQPLSDHTIGIQPANHVFAIKLSVYRNYFLLRIETVHLHRFDKLNGLHQTNSQYQTEFKIVHIRAIGQPLRTYACLSRNVALMARKIVRGSCCLGKCGDGHAESWLCQ